jgi:hypothetical protein
MREAIAVYLIGVLIGLWRTDGPPLTRLGLAVLWPIGPLAFLLTVSGLLVVGLVALAAGGRRGSDP